MLIIILSWLIIVSLVYPVGFAFNKLLHTTFGNNEANSQPFVVNCLSGLLVTTFISSAFCLVIPLKLTAFLLLIVISLSCVGVFRKALKIDLNRIFADVKRTNIFVTLTFLAFICIISLCSYLPSSHYDDGLYYSTSIRWLEEYGTVKGLANLNPRIALNSSWHILQAQFGFRFLGIGLFNDLNGLLYLLVFLYSLGGMDKLIKGEFEFKVILRAIFFVPVLAFFFSANSDVALYNVNFLESPTPDIPVCLLVWMIVLLFFHAPKMNHGLKQEHVLIILYSAWAISIKLSAVPILLLSVYIILMAFKGTTGKQLLVTILFPMILLTPWLTRNVLLSGYLAYPVAAVDIFNVDWKLGKEHLEMFENGVKAFALGADLSKPFTASIFEWFPGWIVKQSFISKTITACALIAIIVYVIAGLVMMRKHAASFWHNYQQLVVTNLILLAGIVFWLNKAPDFRFGYGFLCIFCTIFLAIVFQYFLERSVRYIPIPFFAFVVYLSVYHYDQVWYGRNFSHTPLDYRMPVGMTQVMVDGKPVNIVHQEDSWNGPLPIANQAEFQFINPVFRGATIQSGFRSTIQTKK